MRFGKQRDEEKRLRRLDKMKYSSDFLQLALDAWDKLLEDLEEGMIVLENERELENYFFHSCLTLMKERKFEIPYSIFAEDAWDLKEKYPKKCDLVLGHSKEGRFVAVEFKYRTSINTKEVNEVKKDILKLEKYIDEQKVTAGVFLMIDQTNRYKQWIQPFVKKKTSSNHIEWKKIKEFDTLIAVLLPELEI